MTAPTAIPARPTEITAQWLGAVLGVDVTAVEVVPVGTGQTGATYRIVPVYGGHPGDLPSTFVVKLPSEDQEVRGRVSIGYRSEHTFYSGIADSLAVPLPHCYHCDIGRDGADFVLLMADQAPAVQGDQIEGASVAEAELAVEALAGLHGPRWCDPNWLSITGLMMAKPDAEAARGLGDVVKMAVDITVDKLGDRMSSADRNTLQESGELISTWLSLEPDRYSLLHGDYRMDNLLFDPERTRITVVDWQTIAVGLPARDLAYFVATSVLPAQRPDLEHGLVDIYHRALQRHGVTDYDRQTCWRDYRLGMLQVPLIGTLGFAFAGNTDRGDDMMTAMLTRGCQAIRELGTLELIRESA